MQLLFESSVLVLEGRDEGEGLERGLGGERFDGGLVVGVVGGGEFQTLWVDKGVVGEQ